MDLSALQEHIAKKQLELSQHKVYSYLKNIDALRLFMEYHVFAVWDFMSLLKSLQREITCIDVPWFPSSYSKSLVRLVNEIVLGEESDLDWQGRPSDHFSWYLLAMDEVKADTAAINEFIQGGHVQKIPPAVRCFIQYHLHLSHYGEAHQIAASFFYGREQLIPGMFQGILNELQENAEQYAYLNYYFKRHIEVDGNEHGHMAQQCLQELCADDESKWKEAYESGLKSLELRKKLWDEVYHQLVLDGQLQAT